LYKNLCHPEFLLHFWKQWVCKIKLSTTPPKIHNKFGIVMNGEKTIHKRRECLCKGTWTKTSKEDLYQAHSLCVFLTQCKN
jgi:hypothetical protein